MANEPKKQTGTTDPSNRPNKPGQNPSGGSQPGQQNPGGRRSDDWSDKGRSNRPSDPSRKGGMGDDSDLDTDESENPA
jgi:hypothetical protein